MISIFSNPNLIAILMRFFIASMLVFLQILSLLQIVVGQNGRREDFSFINLDNKPTVEAGDFTVMIGNLNHRFTLGN